MRSIMLALLSVFIFYQISLAVSEKELAMQRNEMVSEQIEQRGITDERVLEAMLKVKRHLFVPETLRDAAYDDRPLPIGHDQTISQPFIVAYMTNAAGLEPEDKVLEIGTGSGYQAAVLAEMVKEVYTVEVVQPMAEAARQRLKELGYKNIKVKWGDGFKGWEEQAPYDAIVVTAAPAFIPDKLIEQLKVGGKMVIPVGSFFQELYLITKTEAGFEKETLLPVAFVPMVHKK